MFLAAIITIFYVVRVVSLLHNPSSITFNRSIVTASGINYVLMFIMLSNVSMFLGLNATKQQIFYDENIPEDQHPVRLLYVIIILFGAIILRYSRVLPVNVFGRFSGHILVMFFRLRLILLLSLLYLIKWEDK